MGERFIQNKRPSLEAQLANFADEIAYNNHDVDDGLRSGLISLEQLLDVSIFSRHLDEVKAAYPDLTERRLIYETVRCMINTLATDLTAQSRRNIAQAQLNSLDDVYQAPPLIGFSDPIKQEQQQLKKFLYDNLYLHFRVMRMSSKASHTIKRLFEAFSCNVRLLPVKYQQKFEHEGHQAIADYIAGMTDRYAIREYQRLFAITQD